MRRNPLTKRLLIARVFAALVLATSLTGLTGSVSYADDVEARSAAVWARMVPLRPPVYPLPPALGRWALKVAERNPRAVPPTAAFRTSPGEMRAGMDRAGPAPAPATPVAP